MKRYVAALALMAITSGANAAVIDFENFVAGDVVTSFSAGGVTGSVTTVAIDAPVNQAMVFNSNNFTGGDDDLQAPFFDNNEFLSFTGLDWDGVTSLTFDFGRASGAIDNISFSVPAIPVPASLPMLLSGLIGLGAISRRRKAR